MLFFKKFMLNAVTSICNVKTKKADALSKK